MAAKPKAAAAGEPVEEAAPLPSFGELVEQTKERDATRLAEMARVVDSAPTAAPIVEEKPATETVAAKTPDDEYMEWFNAQPEDRRAKFAENVVRWHGSQLAEKYGPEISGILEEIAGDDKLKKQFASLTDKQRRSFLFDTAASIYEDPRYAGEPAADAPDPRDAKIADLEKKFEDDRTARARTEYLAGRNNEYTALFNTFPELRFDANTPKKKDFVAAVIEWAEDKTQKAGHIVTYAEAYQELKKLSEWQADNPAARSVPAVSAAGIPKTQAPKTAFEARTNISNALAKSGGLSRLAAELKR